VTTLRVSFQDKFNYFMLSGPHTPNLPCADTGGMARDMQGREKLVWQVDMTREAQPDFFQG
jgi:hypothetical protein